MIQANDNINPEQTINQITELLTKNTSGIIVLPANPSVDAIAAGTALYLGLTKMGKNATIVCSTPPQSELIGADKILNELSTGGDNLVVSFPYSDGSIDKVDYNIQGNTFNLLIIPRQGFPKLEPKQVQFTYTGGKIEFILAIDAPNLNSLGAIYQQNQNQFEGKNLINIDRHLINNSYGLINYVNKTSSSTSELVLKVLKSLRVDIDKDMSTNLYAGLTAATNAFTSYSVNADTFEAAATLLRVGAVKKLMPKPKSANPVSNPFAGGRPQMSQSNNQADQSSTPHFNQPQQHRGEQQTRQIEDVEQENNMPEANAPENWLKPKIFSDKNGLV